MFSQICARFHLWPHRAIKITRSTEVEEEKKMVETRHSRIFMTGNMSKSIKYCGNQFDVATLRFYRSQKGWGELRRDSPRLDLARRLVFGQNGFIYCVPGHKVIKHMPMFWSDATGVVVVVFVLAPPRGMHCVGRGRGMHRQVSDKNEKRYVNFVGTDVKIKPFI